MDRDEIERVLRRKRKPQEKACYPCHRRKVRCDHRQPCSTCDRRGHPEICAYPLNVPAATKRHGGRLRPDLDEPLQALPVTDSTVSLQNNPQGALGSGADKRVLSSLGLPHPPPDPLAGQSNTESSLDPANGTPPIQEVTTLAERTYEGDNSIVAVLRQHASNLPSSPRIREARVSFGLQNTFGSDPFFTVPTPPQRWESLLNLSPQAQEIHKFFPSYRYLAYPFTPFLVDIDQFELRICKYLKSWAARELQDKLHPSDQWVSDEGITFIALLLATLSCGSHFSTLPVKQRYETSRDFVRRAFQALRLANYMLRPSLDAVQTLLILGNTLQNIGQSDGAWVLLGTTVRLAQALGLHTENSGGLPHPENTNRRALWAVIVWQDCFLSVCHGRPPSVSNVQVQSLSLGNASNSTLSYIEVMRSVAYICFEVTESRPDMERSVRLLQTIDDCWSHAQPYLQDRDACCNLQQLLEHLALQINTSFAICFLCRPAIKKFASIPQSENHQVLIARGKEGLQNILKAFLAFQELSIVPLRSWSMIHSALTSMLLLCIWEETRNDSKSRDLQERVLNVLLEAGQGGTDLDANLDHHCHRTYWLSTRHIRALVVLLETIRNTSKSTSGTSPNVSTHTPEQQDPSGAQIPKNAISTGFSPIPDQISAILGQSAPEDYQFPWISTDLSPIAYVDEIMNAPYTDIFEYNEFL